MRSPDGDQATFPKPDRSSAVSTLCGDSPWGPISQIWRLPMALRTLENAMEEPSGEIASVPYTSSISFWGVRPRIGNDHKLAGFPGVARRATNRVESGYQAPKSQKACSAWVPKGQGTL